MDNERITEDFVADCFRKLGYYDDEEKIIVEKQQSAIKQIRKGLAKASKAKTKNPGYPEFIVTMPETPDMLIVVECKSDEKYHESANKDKPQEYAVDGVLHYARHLSPHYTVISIAVSGNKLSNTMSFFVTPKGTQEANILVSPTGAIITEIIGVKDLFAAASFDPKVQFQRERDLIAFSAEMHEFMRDEAELEEKEKPLAVAGTLIALNDYGFRDTYSGYKPKDLPEFWMNSIKKIVTEADLPVAKIENMTQPFTGIEVHPELGKATSAYPKGLLNEIVTMLKDKVLPFITVYHDFDVVGAFYGEFLKYTGGDGKGLGIVLTPKHVTELFSLIANITKEDKVLDICAGTGGFLISAMNQMMRTATTKADINNIKQNNLIGVEQNPSMYALAASNMILRGDGKANLFQGSCFDTAISEAIRNLNATVGMVNPPYAKSKEDLHELRFIEQMLDSLEKGGTGIAIVPVSCVTSFNQHKKNLLKKHTLLASMSMPLELFYPVGTVTCILVFKAKKPHHESGIKTWFGYWRNDGFHKVKNVGRVDRDGKWAAIRDSWVEAYKNREVHAGLSVTQAVTPEDEWVAEAYLETDYTQLTQASFERRVLDYALFKMRSVTGFDEE